MYNTDYVDIRNIIEYVVACDCIIYCSWLFIVWDIGWNV